MFWRIDRQTDRRLEGIVPLGALDDEGWKVEVAIVPRTA